MKDNSKRQYMLGAALRESLFRRYGVAHWGILLLTVLLTLCLGLLGPLLGNLLLVREAHSQSLYYVHASAETLELLRDQVRPAENGIDHMILRTEKSHSYLGYDTLYLSDPAAPETPLYATVTYLSHAQAQGMRTVAGRGEELADGEVLITTALADRLLQSVPQSEIDRREELVGLFLVQNDSDIALTVAGVVRGSEACAYLSDVALAEVFFDRVGIYQASKAGYSLAAGETVLLVSGVPVWQSGKTVLLGTQAVTLQGVTKTDDPYYTWLSRQNIEKLSSRQFFEELLAKQGVVSENMTAGDYLLALNQITDERYFEYLGYYYAEIEDYLAAMRLPCMSIDTWLYHEKGVAEIKYLYMSDLGGKIYAAVKYKEQNGAYPAWSAIDDVVEAYPLLTDVLGEPRAQYAAEYEASAYARAAAILAKTGRIFLLSDADYAAVAGGQESGSMAVPLWYSESHRYIQIHSVSPAKTERYLRALLADAPAPGGDYALLLTADDAIRTALTVNDKNWMPLIPACVLLLVLLCGGMYLVMRRRARLLSDEGNESFALRYLADLGICWLRTVLAAFLVTVLVVSIVHLPVSWWEMISYPWWYTLAVLQVLLVLPLLCGSIPLLRCAPLQGSTPTSPAPAPTEGGAVRIEGKDAPAEEAVCAEEEARADGATEDAVAEREATDTPPRKKPRPSRRLRVHLAIIGAMLCIALLLLSVAGVRYRVLNALWPEAPVEVFDAVLLGARYEWADDETVETDAFPAAPDAVFIYQGGHAARTSAEDAAWLHELFLEVTEDARAWGSTTYVSADDVKQLTAQGTVVAFSYDHRQKYAAPPLEPEHYNPVRTEDFHDGDEYDALLFIFGPSGMLRCVRCIDGVYEYISWMQDDEKAAYFERCVSLVLDGVLLTRVSVLAWCAVLAAMLLCLLIAPIRRRILRLLRHRRCLALLASALLLAVLLGGIAANFVYFLHYAEDPMRTETFLERPDAITVYYNEDGKEKKKRLSDEEIDLVCDALQTLLAKCSSTNKWKLSGEDLVSWSEAAFLRDRADLGAIEFHYDQRRDLQVGLISTAASLHDPDPEPYYTFYGVCDSVTLGYLDGGELYVVGCLNGAYYGSAVAISMSREAASTFWDTVFSCL